MAGYVSQHIVSFQFCCTGAFERNSIVANSPIGGNCAGIGVSSLGNNLSDDATCIIAAVDGDQPNTNPQIDINLVVNPQNYCALYEGFLRCPGSLVGGIG